MKINKKMLFFLMTLIIFIVSVSAVSATDSNTNTTDVQSIEQTDSSQLITDTSTVDNSNTIDNSNTVKSEDNKELKSITKDTKINEPLKSGNTYTVTSSNLASVLASATEGDTLDFQGTFTSAITINKPLNIISTNGNVSISGTTFTVDAGGAYSNITDLIFYNTKVVVSHSSHVTLERVTSVVKGVAIGAGQGHFTARYSSYVTFKDCYIYSEDCGSTCVALTGCDHCIMDGCTVIGYLSEGHVTMEKYVGNLIYINRYNPDSGYSEASTVQANHDNLITNCVVLGPQVADIKCYAIQVIGSNNNVTNCIVNYTGYAIVSTNDSILYTANNKVYGNDTVMGQILENNEIHDEPLTDTSILPIQLSTKIVLDPVSSIDLGQAVTLSGKITDNYDRNIPEIYLQQSGSTIKWTIEETGEEGTFSVNNDGTFSAEITPEIGGNLTLNMTADSIFGNLYASSSTSTGITVAVDLPLDVTIELNPISTVYQNQTITVSGTLKDENDRLLHDNVTISLPDEENDRIVETNDDGTFSITYNPITLGTQTITVTYNGQIINGEQYYPLTTNTTSFTVIEAPQPINTQITLNPIEDVFIQHSTTISGTLKDENETGVYGNITVSLPDEGDRTVETNADGSFSISYVPTNAGEQTITVTFNDQIIDNIKYYIGTSQSGTFTPKEITLELNEIEDTMITHPTTISGSFNADNQPAAGEKINIIITHEEINQGTTDFFNASNWVGSPSIGTNTVSKSGSTDTVYYTKYNAKELNNLKFTYGVTMLSLKGSIGFYNPTSNSWIQLNGYIGNTGNSVAMSIAHDDETVYINASSRGTVSIADKDLSEYYFAFNAQNKNSMYAVTLTNLNAILDPIKITENITDITINADGTFSTEYTPLNDTTYTATAVYENSDGRYYPINSTSQTFNVIDKYDSNIVINDINSILDGSTVTITGSLLNTSTSIPINTAQLKINITSEDTTIIENDQITVNNGTFTYTSTETFPLGEYTVTINFDGDDTHKTTSNTSTFNVLPNEPKNTEIELNTINDIFEGESVTISGTLKDEDGIELCDNITISLPDEGNRTIETNEDGTFSITYTPTNVGQQNITVTYNGKSLGTTVVYYESTNTVTFNLKTIKLELNDISDTVINGRTTISGNLTVDDEPVSGEKINLIITSEIINQYTIDFYNASNWVGSPSIGTNSVAKSGSTAIVYYTKNNAKELNNLTFTFGMRYIRYRNNIGFYNPTSNTWIQLNGYISSTSTASSVAMSIAHDDENIYVSASSSGTVSIADKDLSEYYFGFNVKSTSSTYAVTLTNLNATLDTNVEIDNITVTTQEDGTFSYTYTPTYNSNYTVIAEYYNLNGTNYPATSNIETFNVVDGYESEITINDISSITEGDTVTITGTLFNITTSTPISSAQLNMNISIDNTNVVENEPITVNNDGTFTYTSTQAFNTIGEYTVTINYDGTDICAPSTDSKTFKVQPTEPKNTTIELNPISDIVEEQSVTVSGTLKDEDGNGLSDEIIIYLPDDYNRGIITNADGSFSISYTPTTLGLQTINVTYDGKIIDNVPYYLGTSNSVTFTLNELVIIAKNTSIELDSINDITEGESVTVSGTLKDEDGTGLYKNITISLPDEGNRTIETNNDGTFSISYAPTTVGQQTITVTYNGEIINGKTYYNPTINTITFTLNEMVVIAKETSIEVDNIDDILIKQSVTVSGTLIDEDQTPIQDNITITLPTGNTITRQTGTDGTFSYTYTPTTSGEQTITVTYNGRLLFNKPYYIESTNTITFNVRTLNLVLDEIEGAVVNNTMTITGSFNKDDIPLTGETIDLIISYGVESTEPSFYVASNWEGSPSISGTSVTTGLHTNVVYYKEFSLKDLNDISLKFTSYRVNMLNFGLYNPSTSSWIDLTTYLGSSISQGVQVTITHDDENLYVTGASSGTVSIAGTDLSQYYLAMQNLKQAPNPNMGNPNVNIANIMATVTGNEGETITISDVLIEEDGTFSAQYTPEAMDEYKVTAVYAGSTDGKIYPINSTTQKFNVTDKHETAITIDEISPISEGSTVEITGTLVDTSMDKAVSSGELYINITSGTTIIVENAVVEVNNGTFTYISDETFDTTGDYDVTVSFDTNDYYIGNSNTATFTVIKPKNTKISINDIDDIYVGEVVNISGTLTDEDGTGVQANVTIVIDDNAVVIESDENGLFTYTSESTFNTAGDYSVTVTYAGNMTLIGTDSTATFAVIAPKDTVIEIDNIDTIVVNQAVTVTGTLTDEDGVGIKANITINLPDEEKTIETGDNGSFTFTSESTFDTAGDYNVTVTYAGNMTLIGTSSSATFTVRGPKDTFIEIDEIQNITVNQPVTITGTLTDEDGVGIKANITISLPDEEKIIETEEDGTFTYTSESTFAKGEYTVTITYEGNDEELLIGTTNSKTFTVTKANVTITLDPITANVNDEVTITARVTDVNGNLVNGGKLIFKVNGVTVRDASGKVLTAIVKDGVASIDAVVGKTWTTGSTLEAVYAGTSDEYNSARFSDDTVFTISKAVVDVTVSLDKTSVVAGETIEITATITYNGKLLNNGRIIIKVNGITVKDANNKVLYVTVVNGVAKFNYTVPENWKLGDRNIVVIYDNSAYNRSEGSTDFTIVKDNVTIDITPVVTTRNNTETQITAQIKNSLNKPITGTTKVSIKVNGITFKIITVTDGIIDTTIDTSSLTRTDYTLTFVIGENSRYNSARQTSTLKIE
jgi:hypothetical protein